MPDTIGIETHQARTREIRGYGIVGENDLSEMPVSSVQRPVAFHRHDSVRDDEMHRNCRTNIENAPVDSLPVQDILGQPYFVPGTTPNMFFMLKVTPAQWWVLIFSIDTTKSELS